MILFVILLFGLAVAFGIFLTYMGVRYQRGSMALGLTHAGIAVVALGMLTVQIFREATIHMLYNDAAIVFVLVMAGGLVLLALRNGKEPPPMVVVGLHAVMALVAYVLLVAGYVQS